MKRSSKGAHREEKFALVGLNVRKLREVRGWSQQELAEKIGIARTTVSRIEAGGLYHRSTLARIAEALGDGTTVEVLVSSRKFLNVLDDDKPFVRHENSSAVWYSVGDRRQHRALEYLRLEQERPERQRLGSLELVPHFASPINFFLPQGLEIVRLEVYGSCEQVPMPHLSVVSVYGIAGVTVVEVLGEAAKISPGDAIAFRSPAVLGLRPEIQEGEAEPTVVLIIGSYVGRSRRSDEAHTG